MKVTIIRADNAVAVDGKMHWVDCAALPAYIRVVQWNVDRGQIEFINDGRGVFLPNMHFTDLKPYQFVIDKWNETEAEALAKAKVIADANAAAKEAEAAELERLR